jgi:hypothetical protein
MTDKKAKGPSNIPTPSIPRPSKIYPNWDFGLKINHLATLIFFTANKIFPLKRGNEYLGAKPIFRCK